jgi:hypothetical protein
MDKKQCVSSKVMAVNKIGRVNFILGFDVPNE